MGARAMYRRLSTYQTSNYAIVGGVLLLIGLPVFLSPLLASEILIFAVFALGYNILLGYGGEMSFGHAAYFGLGAYGVILTAYTIPNIYVAMLAGVVLATLGGIIFGWLSLQRRGIYFSMITLAFAQMIYLIVFQATNVTGGSNGRAFPDVQGAFGPLVPGRGGLVFYLLMVVVFVVTLFVVRRIIRSPFGRILVAIRENSARVEALGYDVKRILFVAFVFTSVISGVAGVLYGILFSFVSPNVLFWLTSGEVVLMTIIGGVGTLGGPLVGATIYILLSDTLTSFFNFWEIPFGLIIIGVVIFAPKGLYGIFLDRASDDPTGYSIRRVLERFRDQLEEYTNKE